MTITEWGEKGLIYVLDNANRTSVKFQGTRILFLPRVFLDVSNLITLMHARHLKKKSELRKRPLKWSIYKRQTQISSEQSAKLNREWWFLHGETSGFTYWKGRDHCSVNSGSPILLVSEWRKKLEPIKIMQLFSSLAQITTQFYEHIPFWFDL